jgi:hypothetical protein
VVTQPADNDQPPAEPLLRVVRGDASPEEIAALVAVLMVSGQVGDDGASARTARSAWSDRAGLRRVPLHPGLGTWRRSALPG